eukprot:jgi/Ulvmu1/2406/UM133_0007.1
MGPPKAAEEQIAEYIKQKYSRLQQAVQSEGLSAYLKEPPARAKVNQVFLANTLRTVAYENTQSARLDTQAGVTWSPSSNRQRSTHQRDHARAWSRETSPPDARDRKCSPNSGRRQAPIRSCYGADGDRRLTDCDRGRPGREQPSGQARTSDRDRSFGSPRPPHTASPSPRCLPSHHSRGCLQRHTRDATRNRSVDLGSRRGDGTSGGRSPRNPRSPEKSPDRSPRRRGDNRQERRSPRIGGQNAGTSRSPESERDGSRSWAAGRARRRGHSAEPRFDQTSSGRSPARRGRQVRKRPRALPGRTAPSAATRVRRCSPWRASDGGRGRSDDSYSSGSSGGGGGGASDSPPSGHRQARIPPAATAVRAAEGGSDDDGAREWVFDEELHTRLRKVPRRGRGGVGTRVFDTGPYAPDSAAGGHSLAAGPSAPVPAPAQAAAVLPRSVRSARPEVVAAAKQLMERGVPLELATAQAELQCARLAAGDGNREEKKRRREKRRAKERKEKKRRRHKRRRRSSSSSSPSASP